MAELQGLCFDKLVFDHMAALQADDKNAVMNMAKATKEIGLSDDMIYRAIQAIRVKGYPLIGTSSRRTWENDFKVVQSRAEYGQWREKLISDIRELIETLKLCDAAAKVRFGEGFATQEFMF